MQEQNLEIRKATSKKTKPDEHNLEFGKYFTDHMFIMDYTPDKGWHAPRITPYEPMLFEPSAMVFHYGQTVFEGLKAYRTEDNRILLFRAEQNFKRLNRSSDRISIPQFDEDFVLSALQELLILDKDWVPSVEGTALYIRPFIIATEPNIQLTPASEYRFMIIMSPVGSLYKEGMHPVSIFVEEEYTRAVRGGTGNAKTAGNYSAAYKAQKKATEQGFSQVLWLDGNEKKYIEEVGSMNVFFKINGKIITPQLNGSILEGITRMSIIELLRSWDYDVIERRITMEEISIAYDDGSLEEAFGTGTAAVISPIGELTWRDKRMVINNKETGELSKKLYDTLTGIQRGKIKDPFEWIIEVK